MFLVFGLLNDLLLFSISFPLSIVSFAFFYPHKVIQFHCLHHKFNFVCFFVFFVVSRIVISICFILSQCFLYFSYPSKHCFFVSLAFFMTLFLFSLTRSCSLLLFLSFYPSCNAFIPLLNPCKHCFSFFMVFSSTVRFFPCFFSWGIAPFEIFGLFFLPFNCKELRQFGLFQAKSVSCSSLRICFKFGIGFAIKIELPNFGWRFFVVVGNSVLPFVWIVFSVAW